MTDNREPNGQPSETEEPDVSGGPEAEIEHDSMRNAVGAYLLDALPEDERAAFETFLTTSPETQDELRQLAPVVTLLPQLLELERPGEPAAPAPTADLRDRILSEAEADAAAAEPEAAAANPDVAAVDTGESGGPEPIEQISEPAAEDSAAARTIRTAPPDTGPLDSKTRSRPAPVHATPTRATSSTLDTIRQFPTSWLIAAGLAVVAVGAVIWALALLGQIDNKDREIDAQNERLVAQEAEVANLRNNANATAFTLSTTSDAAPNAGGTLLFSPKDQIGVLYVRDLPPLDDQHVYQLWYLDDQSQAPRPGGTFRVDRDGKGFIVVESDTPTFDAIALTEEPEGGSEAPTSEVVLSGQLGGAAG